MSKVCELGNRMWAMVLNDEIRLPGGNWIVTRVPGGWIYEGTNEGETSVFVPLNNEFVGTGE